MGRIRTLYVQSAADRPGSAPLRPGWQSRSCLSARLLPEDREEGRGVRKDRFEMRLTAELAAQIEQGAREHRTTATNFVRSAIEAAHRQCPILRPSELDELERLREQLRMAGVNLNQLVRQGHLYGNGVSDRPPYDDDLRATTAELREASQAVADFLQNCA